MVKYKNSPSVEQKTVYWLSPSLPGYGGAYPPRGSLDLASLRFAPPELRSRAGGYSASLRTHLNRTGLYNQALPHHPSVILPRTMGKQVSLSPAWRRAILLGPDYAYQRPPLLASSRSLPGPPPRPKDRALADDLWAMIGPSLHQVICAPTVHLLFPRLRAKALPPHARTISHKDLTFLQNDKILGTF